MDVTCTPFFLFYSLPLWYGWNWTDQAQQVVPKSERRKCSTNTAQPNRHLQSISAHLLIQLKRTKRGYFLVRYLFWVCLSPRAIPHARHLPLSLVRAVDPALRSLARMVFPSPSPTRATRGLLSSPTQTNPRHGTRRGHSPRTPSRRPQAPSSGFLKATCGVLFSHGGSGHGSPSHGGADPLRHDEPSSCLRRCCQLLRR